MDTKDRNEKEITLSFYMGILYEDMENLDLIDDMTDEQLEAEIQHRLKILSRLPDEQID